MLLLYTADDIPEVFVAWGTFIINEQWWNSCISSPPHAFVHYDVSLLLRLRQSDPWELTWVDYWQKEQWHDLPGPLIAPFSTGNWDYHSTSLMAYYLLSDFHSCSIVLYIGNNHRLLVFRIKFSLKAIADIVYNSFPFKRLCFLVVSALKSC